MKRSLVNLRLSESTYWYGTPLKTINILLLVLMISTPCAHLQAHSFTLSSNVTLGIPNDGKNPSSLYLLSFTGKSNMMGNQLIWQIPNVISRQDFVVERSTNGRDWKKIGTIPNHPSKLYEALDANPMSGTNYYRIKQVDSSGQSHYSRVIKIHWK